ncbi:hypothetical protein [Ketobacter sp.]
MELLSVKNEQKMAVANSKITRKLMLLEYLFSSLVNRPLGGGVLIESGAGGGAGNKAWQIKFEKGSPFFIIEVKKLRDYAKGRGITGQSLRELESNLLCVFPKVFGTERPITDVTNIPVFKFGSLLGLSQQECRFQLDATYASSYPLVRSLSCSRKVAKEFCTSFSGCYYLYRFDINKAANPSEFPHGVLVKSALSIRYPVPHKSFEYDGNSRRSIKVKLNIPSYSDKGVNLYKYDGLVGVQSSHWWTWIFQGRFGDSLRGIEDVILMYTGSLGGPTERIITGTMLTQNQDNNATPTPSQVVLIRDPRYKLATAEGISGAEYSRLEPDEFDFMRSATGLFDPSDPDSLDATDRLAISRLLQLKS